MDLNLNMSIGRICCHGGRMLSPFHNKLRNCPFVWAPWLLACLLATQCLAQTQMVDYGESSMTVSFGLPNDTQELDAGSIPSMAVAEAKGDGGAEKDQAPDFGSLDSMLHWAIEHSDAEQLAAAAQEVDSMSPEQLALRRQHIRDVVEAMRLPSGAELMKVAIADLENATMPVEGLLRALHELLQLVEPIDHANDLHKLGGLAAVARALRHADVEVRSVAAWVLGKAAQNNPTVQQQVLEAGLLEVLLAMTLAEEVEEAAKALYAVSAAVRNHVAAQEAFYSLGGAQHLVRLLGPACDVRLSRKAVFLLGDLAEQQGEDWVPAELAPHRPTAVLLKAVLELTLHTDLDLQEKALLALRSLAGVGSATRQQLLRECRAEAVLQQCKALLQDKAASDPEQAEYVGEVEGLRQEVVLRLSEKDKLSSNA